MNNMQVNTRWVWLGGAAALALGLLLAYAGRWTCDDAFISFRYARNLVEGHGLVFNPGERVEGYTNFLWTLWIALGLWLGWSASTWADFWSLLSYAGSIVLLIVFHLRLREDLPGAWIPLPLAALGAALHPDWRSYASCGLETSLVTLLLLGGFTLLNSRPLTDRRLAAAGLLMGLAFLTRQDTLIPAFAAGLFVLWQSPRWFRGGLIYGLCFLALALPFLAWRVSYYGDLMPNTYYAKSAYLTWYSQGWTYLTLYFERYWALLAAVPVLFWALWRTRAHRQRAWVTTLVLAASMTAAHMFYIVRVGGDFMFARMLIPVTPFLLILLEIALQRLSAVQPRWGGALGLILLAGLALTPPPVSADHWVSGVADERAYYSKERVAHFEHQARVLARFFKNLPVRIAYLGAEARVAYLAQLPEVIDCYGLTDPYIARLELKQRGRVGHEKLPPADYLIRHRKVHFMFNPGAVEALQLEDHIPIRKLRLGDVEGVILHWDPAVMRSLKARGAQVPDFPSELDAYLSDARHRTRAELEHDFERFQHFYFDHVADPARLAAFQSLLGGEVQ